jgi:D-arginine dehydrogenase
LASRPFFDDPPAGFSDIPLGRKMAVLVHGRGDELEALDQLERDLSLFAKLDRLDAREVHELCPLLKDDALYGIADRNGMRLDPHALLQGCLRELRRYGGELHTDALAVKIEQEYGSWNVTTERGEHFSAPLLVNAAGSWADHVANMAGVRPLGLQPKRRTIITFDPPAGTELDHLPFAKTIGDELYFAPESGRLFASPMDEVLSEPCDAQPDEFEVAMAAYRMEERTTVKVGRIHSKWAGLRTFTADRHPALGFAPDAEGFFWLAGQGGFGLQTSPAMSAIAASLITGTGWPVTEVSAKELDPARFVPQHA